MSLYPICSQNLSPAFSTSFIQPIGLEYLCYHFEPLVKNSLDSMELRTFILTMGGEIYGRKLMLELLHFFIEARSLDSGLPAMLGGIYIT
jgi:hypothetical protein